MFDLIWHMRGSIAVPVERSDNIVLDRVVTMLTTQGKPIGMINPQSVEFRDPLWGRFFNSIATAGNALFIYDQGHISLERSPAGVRLRYDLRSLHALLFCLLGGVLFFLFLSIGDVRRGLAVGTLVTAWLYGGNILYALVRVPRLLKATINEAAPRSDT